jgi:hypothetical protein
MRNKHRIRVVTAGLLLLMAVQTALPVTSGALPIRYMDPQDPPTTVGDPDQPGGAVLRVPLFGLSIWIGRQPLAGPFQVPLFMVLRVSRTSRSAMTR